MSSLTGKFILVFFLHKRMRK